MAFITITTQVEDILEELRPLALWSHDPIKVDMGGTLSGTVLENGAALANARVSVYYRDNGQLVGTTLTNTSGAWSIGNCDRTVAKYYAVAQTPDAYNAVVFDKLLPV